MRMRYLLPLLALLLAAGGASGGSKKSEKSDTVFQTSTIGALMAGVYDGEMTFEALRRRGDFGLGTFNALDGEMVALDGRFFQVRTDGRAYPVPDSARTPFTVVKHFRADRTLTVRDASTLKELEQMLDRAIPSPNVTSAIRIEGRFRQLTTRSVPRQSKPYPSLPEAAKQQTTFQFEEVEGVMVGFRTPEYLSGVNVPGYHFHFLTADRKAGGHVLACNVEQATAQLDTALAVELVLPGTAEFGRANLTGQSQEALDRVERSGDR